MKMSFATQIPPGRHKAEFVDVTPTDHPEYGPGLRWDFRITDGKHAGVIVSRTTNDVATANNSCGKFFAMVMGLDLKDAAQADTDEAIGCVGKVAVERAPSGNGIRVAKFTRENADKAAS